MKKHGQAADGQAKKFDSRVGLVNVVVAVLSLAVGFGAALGKFAYEDRQNQELIRQAGISEQQLAKANDQTAAANNQVAVVSGQLAAANRTLAARAEFLKVMNSFQSQKAEIESQITPALLSGTGDALRDATANTSVVKYQKLMSESAEVDDLMKAEIAHCPN